MPITAVTDMRKTAPTIVGPLKGVAAQAGEGGGGGEETVLGLDTITKENLAHIFSREGEQDSKMSQMCRS